LVPGDSGNAKCVLCAEVPCHWALIVVVRFLCLGRIDKLSEPPPQALSAPRSWVHIGADRARSSLGNSACNACSPPILSVKIIYLIKSIVG
jgi:hypothetical protein